MTLHEHPDPTPESTEQPAERLPLPSRQRATKRNAVTTVDVTFGRAARNARDLTGLSQRDVGNRMVLPHGSRHPIVAHVLDQIDTKGESRRLDSQVRKAVQRLEAGVQAPTIGAAWSYANAIGVQLTTILEAAGLATPRTSLDSAIMGAADLDGADKTHLLETLRVLRERHKR